MAKIKIVGLHGFLGQGSDWDSLIKLIKKHKDVEVWTPDLHRPSSLGPHQNISQWVNSFYDKVTQFAEPGDDVFLMGYSLGGRLGLHLLMDERSFFSGGVIMSANPGVVPEDQLKPRFQNDLDWAKRFKEEPWNEVVDSWNRLSVFNGSGQPPVRNESDYSRECLSQALSNWSVATQPFSPADFKKIEAPVLMVCGAKDESYMDIYSWLYEHNFIKGFYAVPNSGHRLLIRPNADLVLQILSILS